jgi:hypothetical protein
MSDGAESDVSPCNIISQYHWLVTVRRIDFFFVPIAFTIFYLCLCITLLRIRQIIDIRSMTATADKFKVRTLNDSVKFYLPRVEGYLEIVRGMASRYGGMSLIEFDGFFEGKFEPVKYTKVEIHTNDIDEQYMTRAANDIRITLKQKSLAFEYNNKLILVSEA